MPTFGRQNVEQCHQNCTCQEQRLGIGITASLIIVITVFENKVSEEPRNERTPSKYHTRTGENVRHRLYAGTVHKSLQPLSQLHLKKLEFGFPS